MISPSIDRGGLAPAAGRSKEPHAALGPLVAVAFIIALGTVEWLLTLSAYAAAGFGILALALAAYPTVRLLDPRTTSILAVLVAVPVLRLVTVALQPSGDVPLVAFAVVVTATIVGIVAAARACPREWLRLRPVTGGWPMQFAVMLAGVPLGILVLILEPDPAGVRGVAPVTGVAATLVLFAVSREILFRGLLVPALGLLVGRGDVVAAAAIYGLIFVSHGLGAVLAAVLVALVLGFCRRQTGSIVGVSGAHIALGLLVYLGAGALGM